MHKSELLLPAGSLVKLKTAILYGADAVYAGNASDTKCPSAHVTM